MRTHLWRVISVLVLLAMFVSPIGSAAAAPLSSQPAAPKTNMQVINASFVGVSKPLSTLAPVEVEASAAAIAAHRHRSRLIQFLRRCIDTPPLAAYPE